MFFSDFLEIRHVRLTYEKTWHFYLLSCAILSLSFGVILCGRTYLCLQIALFLYGIIVFLKPTIDLLIVISIVGLFRLLYELLKSLRHLWREVIISGVLLTLSYVSVAPKPFLRVFSGLQILSFFVLALSEEFETPLKRWMKFKCSIEVIWFLACFLRMKYFRCSNPVKQKVFRTSSFFTNGQSLNSFGFDLCPFPKITGLDISDPGEKVKETCVGPSHTQFTIERVAGGIIVSTSPRLQEQKQVLVHIAHHPEACFVKEVNGSRGKYCSIEEYADLLQSKDIYMCRFPKIAADLSPECDLDMFSWMGETRKYLPDFCVEFVGLHYRYTGIYSPPTSSPQILRHLVRRNFYICPNIIGYGYKITWRSWTPSDGILVS